jgi:hypothetical protein
MLDQTEVDLELGTSNNRKKAAQKQEQLQFFQDKDSLDLALEGSLLNPFEKFGECLSDCTFILQEKQECHGTSKMQSNLFDKGQFMNSNLHHSCCSQQKGQDSGVIGSLPVLASLNQNQSGIGLKTTTSLSPLKMNPYRRNLSEFGSDMDLDEKLAEVVRANLKAVPLPKPLRLEAR